MMSEVSTELESGDTPMQRTFQVNIRDLIARPGQARRRAFAIELPETIGAALAVIPAGERCVVSMLLESVHEGILVSAQVQTTMHAECGRCLIEFSSPCEVEFQELFAYTSTEADEYLVHGDHVDLEPPLRDAVVLALPFQPVCRADCPGLDPETGELRDVQEGAQTSVPIDARWAALADFTSHAAQQQDHDADTLSESERN